MYTYRVIGLRKFTQLGSSYSTHPNGRIVLDQNGIYESISRVFDYYVLFVEEYPEGPHYAIRFFETNQASMDKQAHLCEVAYMEIAEISKKNKHYREITHLPLRSLIFETKYHVDLYSNEAELEIYQQFSMDPDQWIFRFSRCGSGSDSKPHGYVNVNMDSFYECTAKSTAYSCLPWNRWF